MARQTSVGTVYDAFIWDGNMAALAERLYDTPPVSLGLAAERAREVITRYRTEGWHTGARLSGLKRALRRTNRALSALTPRVLKNIEGIGLGAVEAAHQTVAMGGPCFVLNKAVCASVIACMARETDQPLVPFFFAADYDTVQSELVNTRTPLMGSGGNLISVPVPTEYSFSPVRVLPLPDYEWYRGVEDGIRTGYRALFHGMQGTERTVFEERLEHALSIVRHAFVNSSTLGEWSLRIWARLFNVEGDLGIPILTASDPDMREMMASGMAYLLQRDNRIRFLEGHSAATDMVIDAGMSPGIGRRRPDYVPFFYECQEPGCHCARTELSYRGSDSMAVLEGSCPSCGGRVTIEVSARDPDLSDVAQYISPRVDSRQFAIDMVLPVSVHVGGPGETAYYAQVIPAARSMGVPFPVFVKYPRVYFNTPWNEALARTLAGRGTRVLHSPDLFRLVGAATKARKTGRWDEMNTALADTRSLLLDVHRALNDMLADTVREVRAKKAHRDPDLTSLRLGIERYLSWTFGQFASGKLGQESSWCWVEWAINASLRDLFGPYMRAYVPQLKNGALLFVNFIV